MNCLCERNLIHSQKSSGHICNVINLNALTGTRVHKMCCAEICPLKMVSHQNLKSVHAEGRTLHKLTDIQPQDARIFQVKQTNPVPWEGLILILTNYDREPSKTDSAAICMLLGTMYTRFQPEWH